MVQISEPIQQKKLKLPVSETDSLLITETNDAAISDNIILRKSIWQQVFELYTKQFPNGGASDEDIKDIGFQIFEKTIKENFIREGEENIIYRADLIEKRYDLGKLQDPSQWDAIGYNYENALGAISLLNNKEFTKTHNKSRLEAVKEKQSQGLVCEGGFIGWNIERIFKETGAKALYIFEAREWRNYFLQKDGSINFTRFEQKHEKAIPNSAASAEGYFDDKRQGLSDTIKPVTLEPNKYVPEIYKTYVLEF